MLPHKSNMSDFPKMLVLDLDGTLLDRFHRVQQRDRDAISALQRAGIVVTIATGRLYSGTRQIARSVGIRAPLACMNGNELVDPVHDRSLLSYTVPLSARRLAARVAIRNGLTPVLFASRAVHVCEAAAPWMHYLRDWSGNFVTHEDAVDAAAWERATDALAVALSGTAAGTALAERELAAGLPEGIITIGYQSLRAQRSVLLVRDQRGSKGRAIAELASHHGLSTDQVVAVGDWMNDLSMLVAAGTSFAMGGAPEPVQAAATATLDAQARDGGAVAEIAERVWGIRA